ncbi:hypothetical protein FHR47_000137 [Xanthomonas arboricola]|uniref:Uncharacterized protein n=1 Tax=Xanthomonas cannabis TaxID=1885674 RepID=A0ABR6JGK7_9XANT|nr:hypothetical protein [Xanthomonas cannabis]MBB4591920.1 hypothetical protein [Xanthomonas cannabis]
MDAGRIDFMIAPCQRQWSMITDKIQAPFDAVLRNGACVIRLVRQAVAASLLQMPRPIQARQTQDQRGRGRSSCVVLRRLAHEATLPTHRRQPTEPVALLAARPRPCALSTA